MVGLDLVERIIVFVPRVLFLCKTYIALQLRKACIASFEDGCQRFDLWVELWQIRPSFWLKLNILFVFFRRELREFNEYEYREYN